VYLTFPWKYYICVTTRKHAKGPGQRYQLLLQPVLMRVLWPAAIKSMGFGTGLKHYPVPKPQYMHRLVPPTGTKRTRRNRYRLVAPVPIGGTNRCLKGGQWHRVLSWSGAATCTQQRHRLVTSTGSYAYCLAPVVEHQPVLLSHAYKYPNPSPLQTVVNSLFMAAEWGEGRRIFVFLKKG